MDDATFSGLIGSEVCRSCNCNTRAAISFASPEMVMFISSPRFTQNSNQTPQKTYSAMRLCKSPGSSQSHALQKPLPNLEAVPLILLVQVCCPTLAPTLPFQSWGCFYPSPHPAFFFPPKMLYLTKGGNHHVIRKL